MGKKTKNPTVEAPIVEKKPAVEEAAIEQPAVQVQTPSMPSGLSQDAKVAYMTGIQHRKDEMLKNGGENANHYVALTLIEDSTILDIAVTEAVVRKNPLGLIFSTNEKNWNMLELLAADMGVKIPSFKSLPKPTKEQLKAAGLEAAPGQVVLKLEDKNVSKEAQEKKKKEQKIVDEAFSGKKDYMKDHTKIENDEQLHEALEFQLGNPSITNPIERLITAAQFYRSYREALAEKSDDPQAELAKIHESTLADLLQDITTMVKPTFVATGFGKRLGTLAEDANSIIPAFCGFKNCVINRNTGKYKYTDEEIAMFVRVLIVWYASSKVAEFSEAIKAKEENIAALKKSDEKANAKAIEAETKKIAGLNSSIKHFNSMISLTSEPSFDIVDNFIAAFNNNDDKDHIRACAIAKEIIGTYYRDVEVPELEFDTLLLNVQQHAGIILNLFNSPVGRRDDYSAENLIDITSTGTDDEGGEGEGSAEEGEVKNA